MLQSDLDHFASTNRSNRKLTYAVGLQIAGGFGSGSHIELAESLLSYSAPTPICIFTGKWLTRRASRVDRKTPEGRANSCYQVRTRGAPQEGVPST